MYFEQMRPDELRRQQRASNMVFLPVGPLEWHGPHLPVGTDGLIARAMAERLAGYFGAALLPILYAGGADVLSPAVRQDLGLPENSGSVRGMDFAPGGFPSIYLRESTLEMLLIDYTDALSAQGYKQIYIISGHGGAGHTPVLNRICSRRVPNTVIRWYPSVLPATDNDPNSGHATRMETSVMLALFPERVNLSAFPSVQNADKLFCAEYGMADDRFFRGDPTPDKAVEADPREASAELGRWYLDQTFDRIRKTISELQEEEHI